jgi:hypothetical protein
MVCSWCRSSVHSFAGTHTTLTISFASPCLSPSLLLVNRSPAVSTARPRRFGKLNWFLRDFDYDTELIGKDEIDAAKMSAISTHHGNPNAMAVKPTNHGDGARRGRTGRFSCRVLRLYADHDEQEGGQQSKQ